MSRTCQNHVSKISVPLLRSCCSESALVSPSRKVSPLFMFYSLTYLHTFIHAHESAQILSLFSCQFVFLICLQVSRRKHVMRFALNPAIILTQSSAFLALRHIIWLHRGIPWRRLCKLVCQTPYTWRRNGEGKKSVAINITSLHRLLKMLSLSA